MEQNPIKDSPLGVSGTIDSRPGGREASGNGPTSRTMPELLEKTARVGGPKSGAGRERLQQALTFSEKERKWPEIHKSLEPR